MEFQINLIWIYLSKKKIYIYASKYSLGLKLLVKQKEGFDDVLGFVKF